MTERDQVFLVVVLRAIQAMRGSLDLIEREIKGYLGWVK